MSRVVHFEIHAADPQAAADFYRAVFGWTIERWGEMEYWTVTTGAEGTPGINGGILPRRGPALEVGAPINGSVVTVQVDSLTDTLATALAHGATEALPRMPIPGVGWLAYILDLDHNVVGVMEPDPTATA